jgi:hypothetical protein
MTLTADEKVAILRELTRGPDDVFALRGARGWQPVYTSISNDHLKMHLAGSIEVGAYTLMPPEPGQLPRVWWCAADFDGKTCKWCKHGNPPATVSCQSCGLNLGDWERDVRQATEFLMGTGANVLVNLSRSAAGAHVRVLFKEPVPGWMARRWMQAWLEEAQVAEDYDDGVPTTFDQLRPAQDALPPGTNALARTIGEVRYIGNLLGSPLHGGWGRKNGGTLILDASAAANGDFEPDGRHWEHAIRAIDSRAWGEAELLAALLDAPGVDATNLKPPPPVRQAVLLPVIDDHAPLDFTVKHCEFMRMMSESGTQSYEQWIALASHLHRFGEAGRSLFHEISSRDPRYRVEETERKWRQTEVMHPVRCETLATWGWRCKHLGTNRCGGAWNPAVFYDCAHVDLL